LASQQQVSQEMRWRKCPLRTPGRPRPNSTIRTTPTRTTVILAPLFSRLLSLGATVTRQSWAFTAFGYQDVRTADIQGWGIGSTNSLAIVHNIHPYPLAEVLGAVPGYASHAPDFLPGNNCEYSILRFVAPYKAKYKLSGQFYGLWLDNSGYENADVHIYVNNVAVFNALIDMHNGPTHVSFTSKSVFAALGQPIDFIVGCGTNGNNYYDHVGLNAVIERH
jgi:hypothetical protein